MKNSTKHRSDVLEYLEKYMAWAQSSILEALAIIPPPEKGKKIEKPKYPPGEYLFFYDAEWCCNPEGKLDYSPELKEPLQPAIKGKEGFRSYNYILPLGKDYYAEGTSHHKIGLQYAIEMAPLPFIFSVGVPILYIFASTFLFLTTSLGYPLTMRLENVAYLGILGIYMTYIIFYLTLHKEGYYLPVKWVVASTICIVALVFCGLLCNNDHNVIGII